MGRITIDVRDNISPDTVMECVGQVIHKGKISDGERGKKYYCWATLFNTPEGKVVVETRQYRKNDCFLIYKPKK